MKSTARYSFLLLSCVLLIASISCKKSTGDAPDFNHSYYPFKEGHWVIYQFDSMVHDNGSDTISFQLKEVIADEFYDLEGRLSHRLERYRRNTPSDPWVIKDVWSVTRDTRRLEKFEENVRLVKLLFPIRRNDRWDGNLYNANPEEEYLVTEAHEPMSFAGFELDSTTTVLQADRNNLVDSIYKEEIYAAKVGLIYRQFRELDFGNITAGITGVEFYQTMISYGD